MENTNINKECCMCNSELTTESRNILEDVTSYSKVYYYKIIEEFLNYPLCKVENIIILACTECCTKMNEYDLATITYKTFQKELAEMIIPQAESRFQCLIGEYKLENKLEISQFDPIDPISYNISNSSETEKIFLQQEINKEPDNYPINHDYSDDESFCLEILKYDANYFSDENVEIGNSNINSSISASTPNISRKNYCTPCNTNLSTCKEYKTHCQTKKHESVLNGTASFKCKHCMKSFLTKKGLNDHYIRYHTEEKSHRCSICEEQFSTNYLLNYHRRRYHPDRAIQQCPICMKRLETSYLTVDEHISHVHEGNPVKCKECGMEFKQLTSMFRHRKLIHLNPRLYQCEHCGKKFNENNALQKHIKFTHEKIKNFSCNQCDFKTITKAVLERHKRIHSGEKNYNCEICGKKYVAKYNLERHIKTLHRQINEIIEYN